jgi:endonuclease I
VDNDFDGLVDCADEDCAGPSVAACAVIEGEEGSDAACSDGVDNDDNGYVDCEDWGCSRNPEVTVCPQEGSDAACSDGIDNDNNGHIDCADWGCSRNPEVTVCTLEPEGGQEACSDGLDNDGDGYADCEDEGCQVSAASCAPPGDEATLELCTDGRDNDGDGVRDCQERACHGLGLPLSCGHSLPSELDTLRGRDLEDALYSYLRGQNWVSYDRARLTMYGERGQVDVENGWIECIYTGELVRPDGSTTPGDFNTEHIWPRSLGTDFSPAVGDMFHLAPSRASANSARSSYPFGDTDCLEEGDCFWSSQGSALGLDDTWQTVFQVRPSRRGDVARASFYISIRYGLALDHQQESALRRWHAQDPPDAAELARAWRVYDYQWRINPFILKPELVDRIDDF